MRRSTIVAAVCVLAMLAGGLLRGAENGAVEAKRKAAQQLLQSGKYYDAISLLTEVAATDSARFSDYLLLGRAYDKLNKGTEACEAYRHVLAMATDRTMEERAAKVESDRRLKVLDALRPKIDSAVEEYLRKLDALEREADSSHNASAAERIFRLRGAVYLADGNGERGYCEVSAGHGYTSSTFNMVAGQHYRVRARGRWRMGPGAETECTANGFADHPFMNGAPPGSLALVIGGKGAPVALGEAVDFVAPASGLAMFSMNEVPDQARADNSGKIYVIIERR